MPFALPSTLSVRLRLAALAIGLLALFGCEDAQSPTPQPETCPDGVLGCPCDDGACAEGRCADNLCVACPEGTLRCPCAEGACDGELVCIDDQCAEDACPQGEVDCPCGEDDACDPGLTCMDSTCLPVPECPPGTLDCPCDDTTCDGDLVCINDVCRDCPPDEIGCPCFDGACNGGLICDTGACRETVGCAGLGCGPNQLCQEAEGGADAACLEECIDGFVWDGESCVVAPPTCALDAPTSIAAECADANRACVPDEAGAVCGDCLMGFLEDGGQCLRDERATCDDGEFSIGADCAGQQRVCLANPDGATCGDCLDGFVDDPSTGGCRAFDAFEVCHEESDCPDGLTCSARLPAEDARCLPAACPEGETFDLRQARCTDRCDCQGPGMTGNPWPVTDWNGDCVCETAEGFFFNTSAGSRRAEACDADGDGWTRRSAFVHIESPDEAVRLNARCDLRTIDRVALVNERGQRLDLSVETLSDGLAEFEPLYETDESDAELEALERQAGDYGTRRFHAAELNPLTKACATALDDFNDNGVSDLREHHRSAPDPQRSWMTTFVSAGYFVELNTGHFVPAAEGETHGHYVITERSRCTGDFPVGYDRSEGPYADSCTRRREGDYRAGEPLGHDFQRWTCAEPGGACGAGAPPVAQSIDAVVPHGVCDEIDGEDPEPWRGMTHASQFKCVEIISDQEAAVEVFQRRRGDLRLDIADSAEAAPLNLNACDLDVCPDDAPDCVEFDRDDAIANPGQPRIACRADLDDVVADREALIGRVGFVARRFQAYDRSAQYPGGCIDEQAEWPQLCPGYDPDLPTGSVGDGNPGNFGKIICGCGLNYGGAGCDVGCPSDQLHFGGARIDTPGCVNGYCVTAPDDSGLDGGRSGVWMCGDFTTTAYTAVEPGIGAAFHANGAVGTGANRLLGTITVRGEIPPVGTDGTPLCEATDEDGRCLGITVR